LQGCCWPGGSVKGHFDRLRWAQHPHTMFTTPVRPPRVPSWPAAPPGRGPAPGERRTRPVIRAHPRRTGAPDEPAGAPAHHRGPHRARFRAVPAAPSGFCAVLGRAEPGLTEAGRADRGLTEPGLTEAGLTEAGRAERGRAEPRLTESGRAEPGLPESGCRQVAGGPRLPGAGADRIPLPGRPRVGRRHHLAVGCTGPGPGPGPGPLQRGAALLVRSSRRPPPAARRPPPARLPVGPRSRTPPAVRGPYRRPGQLA